MHNTDTIYRHITHWRDLSDDALKSIQRSIERELAERLNNRVTDHLRTLTLEDTNIGDTITVGGHEWTIQQWQVQENRQQREYEAEQRAAWAARTT